MRILINVSKSLTHNFHVTNIGDYMFTQFDCTAELKRMFFELTDIIITDK
jgi:hypothetical protein